MKGKDRVRWVTRTAALTALLIVAQAATAPLGNTIVTGSIVNMVLVVSVMACGLWSGLSVAVVSPVVAKFFGIGPLWALIPFIVAGNASLVAIWHRVGRSGRVARAAALAVAALAKFLVLYLGVARLAVPFLLGLPEPQATAVSGMFSASQLLTALIGGALAMLVLPALKAAGGEG